MTEQGHRGDDEIDDLFAEHSRPGLAFAITAAAQARASRDSARAVLAKHLADPEMPINAIAASGRHSAAVLLDAMDAAVLDATSEADAARVMAEIDSPEESAHAERAISAYGRVMDLHGEVLLALDAATVLDLPPPPDPDAETILAVDWQTAANRTAADVYAWTASVRDKTGQMLVLKPSPSTGKTEAMLSAALTEQTHRKRVLIAAWTKQVIKDEIVPRIKKKSEYVRLHVILGRDEENCPEIKNVKAVQAHGYAPGRAVCIGCDYYPRNAAFAGTQACEYFDSRIRAQNDSNLARRGAHPYPLIITTHSGLVTAVETGGGMYGRFWGADLVMIDEDPTAAFEPQIEVTEAAAAFESPSPEHRYPNVMAKLLREALSLAKRDRMDAASNGFKDGDGVHEQRETKYAGQALRTLMHRAAAAGSVQRSGAKSLNQVLRDVSDAFVQPTPGSLYGANTTESINQILPPYGIIRIGQILFDEVLHVDRLKLKIYERVKRRKIASADATTMLKIDQTVVLPDTSYQVRLICNDKEEWKFVVQDFTDVHTLDANIIVGDAYAIEDHCRQIFRKPVPPDGQPDPVTVISHRCKFPVGSEIIRYRTKANIRFLEEGGWQENVGLITGILANLQGKKVLFYGHQKLLTKFTELMEKNDSFGVAEWAFEHWWGGRGKDQYKHFDAFIALSEPTQNISGMIDTVNARAFRDAKYESDLNKQIDHSARISISFSGRRQRVAHAMRAAHWRVHQEHLRQNVNELAQAMHRTRGFMAPKNAYILSERIELTRDTLAASVTVQAASDSDCGSRWQGTPDAFLTSEEATEAILSVHENIGVWSPAFLHAFLVIIGQPSHVRLGSAEMRRYPVTIHGHTDVRNHNDFVSFAGGRTMNSLKTYNETEHRPSSGSGLPARVGQARLSGEQTLCERAVAPPPFWERANEYVVRHCHHAKVAQDDSVRRFRSSGRVRPSWWGGARPGTGYAFYSDLPMPRAFEIFTRIMNECYGPTIDHQVLPPLAPDVPF